MSTSFVRLSTILSVCLLAGCAGYRVQHAAIESAAELPRTRVPPGPLDFETAVRLLIERHPELLATRADIAAVNVNPGPSPLAGSTQVMDGRVTETMIGTDILSLLGIGPRAAERALARALRSERICAHHERARALVGELAEAFAVERALRGLEPPEAALDIEAFESAGLASKSVLAAARSVRAEGEAERRILDAQWQDARREIARLIAAAPDAALDIAPVGDGWPSLAEPDRQRLVLARGDLQRLLASWRVADRRYRYAVARQYPNLVVGLGTNVDMRTPMQLVRLELPLDAPAEARAASHARDAAFHRLDAGVLGAMHDAESARLGLVESEAMLESSTERQRAARALLRAQGALLETTPTALGAYVLVAGREIDAAHQVREAAVAAARARVRAARAAGWPAPEMLGDAR